MGCSSCGHKYARPQQRVASTPVTRPPRVWGQRAMRRNVVATPVPYVPVNQEPPVATEVALPFIAPDEQKRS